VVVRVQHPETGMGGRCAAAQEVRYRMLHGSVCEGMVGRAARKCTGSRGGRCGKVRRGVACVRQVCVKPVCGTASVMCGAPVCLEGVVVGGCGRCVVGCVV